MFLACRGWYPDAASRIHPVRHVMSATILAIDVGKFNSVLCWYEPANRAAISV
jgi:hypothetical protein